MSKTRRGQGAKRVTVDDDKPIDIGEIKTEFATELRKELQRFRSASKNLPTSVSFTPLILEIDSILKQKKPADNVKSFKISARQALSQLRLIDSQSSASASGDAAIDLAEMKSEIEEGLARAYDREAYAWFFAEATKLKTDLTIKRDSMHTIEIQAKAKEVDDTLRHRIAQLKNCDIKSLDQRPIRSIDCTVMSNTVKEVLFHPVWLSRRLEREFGVIIDKSKSTHIRQNGCLITGLRDDVNACTRKLENLDFSGKKSLILDARSFAKFMGHGDAKAHEVELKTGAIIFGSQADSEVTLFGSEEAIEKAMAIVGDLREVVAGDAGLIAETVVMNFFVAKALLSDAIGSGATIEKTYNVAMSLAVNEPDATVTIRGSLEGVSGAVAAVHRFQENARSELFQVEDHEACAMLFESSAGKKSLSEVRLLAKFGTLRRDPFVFISRDSSHRVIGFVAPDGDGSKLEAAISEIRDAMIKVKWTTTSLDVAKEHNRCWGEAISSMVSLRSDAEIVFRRSDNIDASPHRLEVWGSEEAKARAMILIDEVHTSIETDVRDEVARPLLDSNALTIVEIQEACTVHLSFAKFDKKLFIFGLNDCKKQALSMFKEFVARVMEMQAHLTIKEVELRREEVGLMIGPKGKTVRRIQEASGCDDVRVDGDSLKVVLTGSAEAVDSAILMIEEELNSKKTPVVIQGSMSVLEEPERVRMLGAKSGEGWTVVEEAVAYQVPVLESEECFPALGAKPTRRVKQ